MTHTLFATLAFGIAALVTYSPSEPPASWIDPADAATEAAMDIALDHLDRASALAFEDLDAEHLHAEWEHRAGAEDSLAVFVLTRVEYVSELDLRSTSLTPTSVRRVTVTATPDERTAAAPVQVFALVTCAD